MLITSRLRVPARLHPDRPGLRRSTSGRRPWLVAGLLTVALVAGCTGTTPPAEVETADGDLTSTLRLPDRTATVAAGETGAGTALAASRSVFASAGLVVVADPADPAALGAGASLAVAAGAPLLLADEGDSIGAGVRDAAASSLSASATADPSGPAATAPTPTVSGSPTQAPTASGTTAPAATASPSAMPDEAATTLAEEVDRLGAVQVLAVGADLDPDRLGVPDGVRVTAVPRMTDVLALTGNGLRLGERQPVADDDLPAVVAGLTGPVVPVLARADGDADPSAPAAPTAGPSATATTDPAPADTDAAVAPVPTVDPADSLLGGDTTITPPDLSPTAGALALHDPLADPDPGTVAALATARAAGLTVVDVPGGDPRASAQNVEALTGAATVVGLGESFGPGWRFTRRVASAVTGTQLPGGGQLVFPSVAGADGKKYIALYGTPGSAALGVLGEQDVPATIARAQSTAAQYEGLTGDTVVPTVEIIASIASAGPGEDGSYSRMRPVSELLPLVEAAEEAGVAVIIDLQPGRTDFLTQAQAYEELLAYPHVGLALDPEWRLKPDQVHLRQIGSVSVDEVNEVADWLATVVRQHDLPQKVFLLHQFSLRMITDRDRLDTRHDELAVMIHADGQGSQPAKADTWRALHHDAPRGAHWGWKNFYDEDQPMLTPEQTYQVDPVPDLVTYQ